MVKTRTLRNLLAASIGIATLAVALHPAPAQAHGRRAGWFVGGLVVGAALAPRYVYSYPAPVYYPPPTYYVAPPAVVYTQPPVVYTQPPVVVQQPAPVVAPPAAPAPSMSQTLTVEQRLQRLKSMCDQGLFTTRECETRRGQILQEM